MFGHLSAVWSRRLGENVLCHICCAHVLMCNGNFTQRVQWCSLALLVPPAFGWDFSWKRMARCHFCKTVKGYRINCVNGLPRWARVVSGKGWCGAGWNGARDIFFHVVLFYSFRFYILGSICKQYLLLTVFLRGLKLSPLNYVRDFFTASLHLCRSEMEVCTWQWKMS